MLKKLNQTALYIFIFVFIFCGGISFSFADENLPDFTIGRLYLPANNQYAGGPFNAQDMQVTIKNLAGQVANNVKLDFLISNSNNETVCQGQGKTIGLFNAWSEKEFTLDRNEFINCPDLTAGDYRLKAMADYGDKIKETNEDNNFKEVSFAVKSSASAPAISSQTASVSGTTERRISFSYYLFQYSDNSLVEYATEDFFGSQKKYSLTVNPTMLAGYYFYAVASTTEGAAYRWRVKMQDSNLQSPGQVFVLMPEDKNPWLNALSFKDLLEVQVVTDTGAKIVWRTNKDSSTKVTYEVDNYLVNGGNIKTKENSGDSVKTHTVELTGLLPNTHYYYKIESTSGTETVSFISHFFTNSQMFVPASEQIKEEPTAPIPVEPEKPAAGEPTAPAAQCLSSAVAAPGDLIKSAEYSSVYYYGRDCKRYVFPNEKIYFTWYKDFTGVKIVSGAELASVPIGNNVSYRPGVKMVKITTNPTVYAVAKNGVLRSVKNESIAKELYGEDWNKKIDDVPDAFFTNYTIGAELNSALDYSVSAAQAGSLDINTDKSL